MTILSFFAGILGVVGAAGAYFKWFAAPFSFYVILGALAIIALNLPVSLVRFIRHGRRAISFIAIFFGVATAAALGLLFKAAIEHPLTDVTNQPHNAPSFRHPAASIPAPGMEEFLDPSFHLERSYNVSLAEKQKRVYPNIRNLFLGMRPEHAVEVVKDAVGKHPEWRVVRMDGGGQTIEIEETHPVFNTVEDFVIETVVAPQGSFLLLRSRSRFGFTDFGSNAKRIRAFSEELVALGRAAVPPFVVEIR